MPARFAPAGSIGVVPEMLIGRRLAVPVAGGGPVGPLLLEPAAPPPGAGVGRGERAAEVVAAAAPGTVPRARAWTCSSRATAAPARGRPSSRCRMSRCSPRGRPSPPTARRGARGRPVAATLRVSVRQAVYLAAAGSFAREIRLLARAPGDRGRLGALSAQG